MNQTSPFIDLTAFANDPGEPEGEGDGEGTGEIAGDGVGRMDGDGRADGDGDGLGKGEGDEIGEGEGNGSPKRLEVRGAGGWRSERRVEGMLGGATGADGGRLLT